MNEEEMQTRLLARDDGALSAIREHWGRPAQALARRITGSEEDAEECVQDGLLAVWESVPPKQPESLGHYFTALVRNAALNRWRDERRLKRGGGTVRKRTGLLQLRSIWHFYRCRNRLTGSEAAARTAGDFRG